jgi:phosphoglycolate phosphatase-like HAD superfamily hydrolase
VRAKLDAFHALFAEIPRADEIRRYLDANSGVSRYVKFRHIHEEILRIPYGQTEEDRLDRTYSDMILERVLASPFVRGAEDFLAWCPLPIDVVSAMPLKELKLIVAKRGLSSRFQELHGSPGKKARQLADILASRSLSPAQLLFVGDSAEDGVAAREAGVPFVGRLNPDNPFEFPLPRVADLAELKDLLSQLLQKEAA